MFPILSVVVALFSHAPVATAVDLPRQGVYDVSAVRAEGGTCGTLTENGAVFPTSLEVSRVEGGGLRFAFPGDRTVEPFTCAAGAFGVSCDGFDTSIAIAPEYRLLVLASPTLERVSADGFHLAELERVDCRGAACETVAAQHGITFPCEVHVGVDFGGGGKASPVLTLSGPAVHSCG